MNIVYIYADNAAEMNCSQWRCFTPAKALAKAGHTTNVFYIADFYAGTLEVNTACQAADIIVIERNLGEVLNQIRFWRDRHKVVVADFDDAYDLMPPSNVSYGYWGLGEIVREDGQVVKLDRRPLDAFKHGLALCNAATTPSKMLVSDWQNYTHVYQVPNYIDLDKYLNSEKPQHTGIVIGWGGSMSHLQSFTGSGVAHALKRICRDRPNVRVAIHTADRRVYDALPIKEPQKYLSPWVSYAEWSKQLATFDIGLAPLHGAYDDRRSWIKVLEYMAMQIPWVASAGPAYADLEKYGRLVRNQPIFWEKAIVAVIDQLDQIDRASPLAFANSCSILNNVGNLVQTYQAIIKNST